MSRAKAPLPGVQKTNDLADNRTQGGNSSYDQRGPGHRYEGSQISVGCRPIRLQRRPSCCVEHVQIRIRCSRADCSTNTRNP